MNYSTTQNLIERLNNLLSSEARQQAYQLQLQPVQIDVLVYLSQCNRFSDTLLTVAQYLRLTKGTVSKSITALHKKGYIEKHKDTKDKRIQHLKLTAAGADILSNIEPSVMLSNYLNSITKSDVAGIDQVLLRLLNGIQKHHGKRLFGVCKSCRFHVEQSAEYALCDLTKEQLKIDEWQLICREFDNQ